MTNLSFCDIIFLYLVIRNVNVAYDIAYINDYGGLRKVVKSDMIKEGQNIYARMYEKYKKKATNQINKIKETYAALPY